MHDGASTRPVLPWTFAIPIIAPRFGAPPVLYPRRFDSSPQFNPTLPRPRQFPRASHVIFCYFLKYDIIECECMSLYVILFDFI